MPYPTGSWTDADVAAQSPSYADWTTVDREKTGKSWKIQDIRTAISRLDIKINDMVTVTAWESIP